MEPETYKSETAIRAATVADTEQVCDIYNHYVRHTTVTFEEEPVTSGEMQQRIDEVVTGLPWLVWAETGRVLGFCYAGKWKMRHGYRYAVESSIYLHPDSTGLGIGTRLYSALLRDLRQRGLHVVIGGIALPNQRSVALHERMGFRKTAHFEQVGWKFNQWIDVGYWQLFL